MTNNQDLPAITLKWEILVLQIGHLFVDFFTELRQSWQRHRWLHGSISVLEVSLIQIMHSLVWSPLYIFDNCVTMLFSSNFYSNTFQCCLTFLKEYSVASFRTWLTTLMMMLELSTDENPFNANSFVNLSFFPTAKGSIY